MEERRRASRPSRERSLRPGSLPTDRESRSPAKFRETSTSTSPRPGDDAPRRLTYHPSADVVQGWSPDGSRILFSSDRLSDHFRSMLFTMDASGGHPEPFPMHKAFRGSLSPDGKTLAYTPIRDAFRTWKRYRGGQTTPIWLVDLGDYSHVEIPHENASDTSPLWMGNDVYFLSDRSEVMSIFRYRLGEREGRRESIGTVTRTSTRSRGATESWCTQAPATSFFSMSEAESPAGFPSSSQKTGASAPRARRTSPRRSFRWRSRRTARRSPSRLMARSRSARRRERRSGT